MANNMFLKFTGGPVTIEGETLDSDHKLWVDIETFSWGEYHEATFDKGGGGSSGAARPLDFNFVKKVDSASHTLFQALVQASHVETVNLEIIKTASGGEKYAWYQVELSPVMITHIQSSGSGDPYMESVTLAYGKAKFTYRPQDEKGAPGAEKITEFDYQATS
jgi:type VI secretion system secreted protein Hcp